MHFIFEHILPLPRESLFAFFGKPEHLPLLHAGWSKIRLLQHETQVRVGAETWVELTLARFIPMVLGFRHFLFEPSYRFGEEAIHGPFSKFVHIHEFRPQNGSTVVRDLLDLEVCLPWNYGAETTMNYCVASAVKRMFRHRAEALTRLASDGTMAGCASGLAPTKER